MLTVLPVVVASCFIIILLLLFLSVLRWLLRGAFGKPVQVMCIHKMDDDQFMAWQKRAT